MSRTHKTGRFRNTREKLLDLAEEIVGTREHAITMSRTESGLLLSDARYVDPTPDRSGQRYGNKRRIKARLKVSSRRKERRQANMKVEG